MGWFCGVYVWRSLSFCEGRKWMELCFGFCDDGEKRYGLIEDDGKGTGIKGGG